MIKELFGHYSYELNADGYKDISELLILYGDNGSGKTTILKILFNLLSGEDEKGRKTVLANIRFKEVSVFFSDNISVHAIRKQASIGTFKLIIRSGDTHLHEYNLPVEHEGERYVIRGKHTQEYHKLLDFLKNRCSVFFLSDNRKLYSFEEDEKDHFLFYNNNNFEPIFYNQITKDKTEEQDLSQLITSVETWLSSHVLAGSQRGEEDTNDIYKEILKRIYISRKLSASDSYKNTILKKIKKLYFIVLDYSKYGLLSPFNYEEFENILNSVEGDKQSIACQVIEPYMNGLEARINALAYLYYLINSFINILNDFLSPNKMISYSIKSGFRIYYVSGEELKFNMLSSGEKQLLFLFCNVLMATEKASLFLIDEPELSLNIKWQRKLLASLLTLNKDQRIQFILASHSFEILAKHRENVIDLRG